MFDLRLKVSAFWSTWGGSVECLTLDFGSGHDLLVYELSPTLGSELTPWSLLGILSLLLSLPLPHSLSLSLSFSLPPSLSQNKYIFLTKRFVLATILLSENKLDLLIS